MPLSDRLASSYQHHLEENMYRIVAAFFLLLVSAAASSAQGLLPAVWQGQRGSVLKVLTADPGTGNFAGVFLSSPVGPCPAVPYDVVGRIQGPRLVFQTSRNWTSDCRVTTVGSGRFVSPTTVVTRWIATYVGPDGEAGRPFRSIASDAPACRRDACANGSGPSVRAETRAGRTPLR